MFGVVVGEIWLFIGGVDYVWVILWISCDRCYFFRLLRWVVKNLLLVRVGEGVVKGGIGWCCC